jgi:hypothetical protein
MKIRQILLGILFAVIVLITKVQATNISPASETSIVPTYERKAELLVTDIYGLSGIRQVGPFHARGAITSNPEFLIATLTGNILDPERLLVSSASNYGLSLHHQQMLPGAILSLDVNQGQYAVPDNFASQAKKAMDGKVMLYSGQNQDYINGYYNRSAVTQDLPNVANPTYISINNAFGRPWQANSPFGVTGAGLISVSDPNGKPLANPPSIESGGVFFGKRSNRLHGNYETNTTIRFWLPGNIARKTQHQYISGDLDSASISTAFLGISPDSSNLAVFAAVGADGRVSQVHVQDGVDGLSQKPVIKPHKDNTTIAGTVFRWIPDFALYISDFYGDRIALLNLTTDDQVYHLKAVSYLNSPEIQKPVDIAAVIPEIANPRFSSNTTLAGTSDLYIANQNGTLLRMNQAGKILAKVKLKTDYENSLNGEIKSISTSYDAQTIFIGMEGRQNRDFIVKIPAFNADGFYPDQALESSKPIRDQNYAPDTSAVATADLGQRLFKHKFTAEDGIRGLFNADSCVSCHHHPIVGGFSPQQENFVRRVSQYSRLTGYFNPIDNDNYPVAKRLSLSSFGDAPHQKAGIPRSANIIS